MFQRVPIEKLLAAAILLLASEASFAFCELKKHFQELPVAQPQETYQLDNVDVTKYSIRTGKFKKLLLAIRIDVDGKPWRPKSVADASFALVNYLPETYLKEFLQFHSIKHVLGKPKTDIKERFGDIAFFIDEHWAGGLGYSKDKLLTDRILVFLAAIKNPMGMRCKGS